MTPADRSTTAPTDRPPHSKNRKMKAQDPNTVSSTGSGVTATGQIQKTILPKVRYHPTIVTRSPGDGGRAKTTSQTQTTRPDVIHPKNTDEAHQDNHKSRSSQVNPISATGSGVTATGQIQKTILPKVRYHPTILTQLPGDGGRAKTTSQTQSTRPDVIHTKNTDEAHQDNHKSRSSQVNPISAVRPLPDGGQQQNQNTPVQKPVQKPVQRPAADMDAPQTPEQISQAKSRPPSDHAPPRLEEVPLGLGIPLARRVVDEVEVRTRGQRENPAWFAWRQNRITASSAHRIAHCRFVSGTSQTPPASYLAAITGEEPSVQTRAMSWGVQREEQAIRQYQVLKSRVLGRAVTVRECGLFIDAQRPWLAASPDGIVMDSQTGQWLLCLEVKCPYKHRQRKVEEACRDDRAFCLEIQEEEEEGRRPLRPPVYRVKPDHSYYTQIQCQLAVSGLQRADLVVFTLRETAIVPVTFNPDLWEETVAKLEVFYRDGLLPHLRERRRPDASAGTPEQ